MDLSKAPRDVLAHLSRFLEVVSLTRFTMVSRRICVILWRCDRLVRWRRALREDAGILKFACSEDDVEALEQYHNRQDGTSGPLWYGMHVASVYGRVRLVEFYIARGVRGEICSMIDACEYGHVELVAFLLKNRVQPNIRSISMAVKNRHFEVVNLLLAADFVDFGEIFRDALQCGCTSVAQLLISNNKIARAL